MLTIFVGWSHHRLGKRFSHFDGSTTSGRTRTLRCFIIFPNRFFPARSESVRSGWIHVAGKWDPHQLLCFGPISECLLSRASVYYYIVPIHLFMYFVFFLSLGFLPFEGPRKRKRVCAVWHEPRLSEGFCRPLSEISVDLPFKDCLSREEVLLALPWILLANTCSSRLPVAS